MQTCSSTSASLSFFLLRGSASSAKDQPRIIFTVFGWNRNCIEPHDFPHASEQINHYTTEVDLVAVVVVIAQQLDLQLLVQSVPLTTNAMVSNPVHSQVYSTQHYVTMFVSDSVALCRQFSPGTLVSPINKTDCHDITEILLKVALNNKN